MNVFFMAIDSVCIPTYMFNVLLKVLGGMSIDLASVTEGSHLSTEDLEREETRVSFQQALLLIGNALRLSPDPGLGLSVAKQINITDWGMFGYAVASCGSMSEALRIGLRYSGAATRLTENSVHITDTTIALQSDTLYPVGDLLPFFIEEDFGGIINILYRTLGQSFRPQEVQLSYVAPSYAERYKQHFQCPVRFGCPANQIVWDVSVSNNPLPAHNPAAAKLAIKMCEELIREQASDHDLVEQVRCRLLQTPGEFASIGVIAEELGMSESTLRRSLKALGASYQSVLDGVREKMAIQYLMTSNLLLEDIAYLVGFSDVSNFRKAFKKWTGRPPLSYRKKVSGP